jgi:riboflavin-specific deaminase-like protein
LRPIVTSDSATPSVVAQLGQSLDGRIATPTGASNYGNGADALGCLLHLGAAVDAVVVGIGTVLADDPLLTVRGVAGRNPSRVINDPNGPRPNEAKCLSDGTADVYVVSSKVNYAPDGIRTLYLASGPDGIDPRQIVNSLFAAGFRRILIEGGANTVSRFVAAGVVDRLYLLVAPILLGSGKTGLCMPPIDGLEEAMRPTTRCYSLGGSDVLFDCCFKSRPGEAQE